MFNEYSTDIYVLDVSTFISADHLQDMIMILDGMADRRKITIILPTMLYYQLKNVATTGHISPKFQEILKSWTWRKAYHKDRPITVNFEYKRILLWFFKNFKVEQAEKFIRDINKLGEQTLTKDYLISRLGKILGSIVFEILAVSHKLRCVILAFGSVLISFVRKVKITTIMFSSKLKGELKNRTGIRRTLKILGYIATTRTIQQVLTGIFPDPSILSVGVLLIADG